MLDKWMAEFHYLLTYSNTALAESDVEKESVVDAVKAAVCENINLFIQINEDEFEKYLKTFAQDVWTQLSAVSLNPGQVGPVSHMLEDLQYANICWIMRSAVWSHQPECM